MFRIYTGDNYPVKFEADEVITSLSASAVITTDPEQADYFLFPVNYEKLYGYTRHEYDHYGYTDSEINNLKNQLDSMLNLAQSNQKKTLLFYYFDPIKKLDITSTVVFRTSLLKSKKQANEFAMPAYMKDLRKQKTVAESNFWIAKTTLPTVGFRGQSAPIKLPVKLKIKRQVNRFLKAFNFPKQINLHYNFGYLARRDAIKSFLNNKHIITDITLTTMEQSWDPVNSKTPFLDNVFNNQYNLCVSGHGNYSFRLYEILSAGRIPVFINTDCVLPFEEFIDWKKHVVWIEEKDASKAAQHVSNFHQSITEDDFIKLQKSNRSLWENYLCKDGFYKSLPLYFPLIETLK